MQLSEFIERSNQAQTIDDLVRLYCQALESYGYTKFCNFSAQGLQPDTAKTDDDAHYNHAFLEHYEKYNYIEIDPIFKLFLRARAPFTWEQVRQLPLHKKQKEVMDVRRETGSLQGISMPVHSPDRDMVGMSLSSDNPDARTDKNAVTELYAISNQLHLCRAELLGKQPLSMPQVHLSPREKEVLQWCSRGKSNSVIGEILSISEKTVEYHLHSIYRKLDVSSRTVAVLKAVNLQLITA